MNRPDVLQYASDMKAASVLVPLILCGDGKLKILLTKRARHLRRDGGDVAFPGGKRDEEDKDVRATALREAWEEIGLYHADVEVISQLPPVISRHGYYVTPVTALIPEHFEANINPNEVEDVFQVPLEDFLTDDHHTSHMLERKRVHTRQFTRMHFFTYYKNGQKYVTYGLTAYLCIQTACIVYDRLPDFDMEPGFDYKNLTKVVLDHIEKLAKEKVLSTSKL